MCGKFTQMASWAQVHDYSSLLDTTVSDDVRVFTPMRMVPVVHVVDGTDRVISPMVWGFTDRKPAGRRVPRHMHARGETVHQLRTFADAFRYRRGITFAKTFNEGKEIGVTYDDDSPAGSTWTQQWTIRHGNGQPVIIGVIFDIFDAGRGPEGEFVQVTTPANALISTVTDRMPLVLQDEDLDLWLGEQRAPIEEVIDLIRTVEFDESWDFAVEDATKKPPRPRKPKARQDGFL